MSDTHPLGPHFRIAVTRPLGHGTTAPGAADPNEVTEILILKARPREAEPTTLQLEQGTPTSELATDPRPAEARLETPGSLEEPRARRTRFLDGLWRRFAQKRSMPGSR